jgi:hypothetical protein
VAVFGKLMDCVSAMRISMSARMSLGTVNSGVSIHAATSALYGS